MNAASFAGSDVSSSSTVTGLTVNLWIVAGFLDALGGFWLAPT